MQKSASSDALKGISNYREHISFTMQFSLLAEFFQAEKISHKYFVFINIRPPPFLCTPLRMVLPNLKCLVSVTGRQSPITYPTMNPFFPLTLPPFSPYLSPSNLRHRFAIKTFPTDAYHSQTSSLGALQPSIV